MYNSDPYYGTTMNYFCETKELQPSPITNHQVAKPCKTEVLLAKSVPDDALKMSVSCSTVTTNQLRGSVLSNDASTTAYWKCWERHCAWAATWHNLPIRLKWPQKITTYFSRINCAFFGIKRVPLEFKWRYLFFPSTTLSLTGTIASNGTANIPCMWLHTPRKYMYMWRLAPRILNLGKQ